MERSELRKLLDSHSRATPLRQTQLYADMVVRAHAAEARLAEAERLLSALADMSSRIGMIDSGTFYYECPACGNAAESSADIDHRPDCAKEQARAFLAGKDGAG